MEEDIGTPALSVILERKGKKFRAISRYSLTSNYLTSTDGFSFTAVEDPERRLELFGLELEPVELSIDGSSQVLGRIDRTSPGKGTARQFSGRDYISDLVECHVDPSFAISEGFTLADAIKLAAGPVGISTVLADSDAPMRNIRTGKTINGGAPAEDFRKAELKDFKSKPGEGIYELLNRLAARHRSTIQPATSRDTIVLAAPNYSQEPTHRIVRRLDGVRNNIISAEAVRDYSSFPTFTIGTGRFGASSKTRAPGSTIDNLAWLRWAPGDAEPAASSAGVGKTKSGPSGYDMRKLAEAIGRTEISEVLADTTTSVRRRLGERLDDASLLYRLHTYKDEQARTQAQLDSSTRRRISELLKPTLIYSVTVKGHRDPYTGALWAVDTMADVDDEIEQVNESLWCASRTFMFDGSGGRTTALEYWRPASYQL